MKRRYWTEAEVATLELFYPYKRSVDVAQALGRPVGQVYAKAAERGLTKSAAFYASDLSARIKRGRRHPRMVASQFPRGHVPWNKGTHYTAGGRSAETRFKPGNYSRRWDREAYGVGALRITTDSDGPGTLQIKVSEGIGQNVWVEMSHYAWWSATGRWPRRGQVVVRKNGDPDDTRFENLELVKRAELAYRNRVWTRYPPEVARLFQLKGAISRAVNRIVEKGARG